MYKWQGLNPLQNIVEMLAGKAGLASKRQGSIGATGLTKTWAVSVSPNAE